MNSESSSNKTSKNPGVGMKMTAPRIYEERCVDGPSPQCYNVTFALTEREIAQNKLMSQRYIKDYVRVQQRKLTSQKCKNDYFRVQQRESQSMQNLIDRRVGVLFCHCKLNRSMCCRCNLTMKYENLVE